MQEAIAVNQDDGDDSSNSANVPDADEEKLNTVVFEEIDNTDAEISDNNEREQLLNVVTISQCEQQRLSILG